MGRLQEFGDHLVKMYKRLSDVDAAVKGLLKWVAAITTAVGAFFWRTWRSEGLEKISMEIRAMRDDLASVNKTIRDDLASVNTTVNARLDNLQGLVVHGLDDLGIRWPRMQYHEDEHGKAQMCT